MMERDPTGGAAAPMRIGIGIATLGRASILREGLHEIASQSRAPDKIIVCHASADDVVAAPACSAGSGAPITYIQSPAGLPLQRNAILDAAADLDAILFIDDDFLMVPDYVAIVEAALRCNPGLVAVTGTLIHDDVKGPGLTFAAGRAMIDADLAARGPHRDLSWRPAPHGYGCNMALRLSTVREHGLRFDERLPLYGWSEDIDFTHRIARFGTIGKLSGARGVHLGVKQGRSSGRRLGYSQVANPLYLLRKGSYSTGRAGRSVARNLAANAARALWPEPYIDRRGRLWGNMLAFMDLFRGRMRPENVLDL
jgi:GT2 family glycosyltransferase